MKNMITVITTYVYIILKMRRLYSVKNTSEWYLQTKLSIFYCHVLSILKQIKWNQKRIMQIQRVTTQLNLTDAALCILYFHISNNGTNSFSSILRNSLAISALFLSAFIAILWQALRISKLGNGSKLEHYLQIWWKLREDSILLIQSPTAEISTPVLSQSVCVSH